MQPGTAEAAVAAVAAILAAVMEFAVAARGQDDVGRGTGPNSPASSSAGDAAGEAPRPNLTVVFLEEPVSWATCICLAA